jgi:hypothetical protein
MSKKTNITTILKIPAYSAENKALLIAPSLTATPQNKLIIQTNGHIATALKPALTRAISIMSSINPAWHTLLLFKYDLKSQPTHFLVKDTRSAGLALAISLINIHRQYHKKSPVTSLIGTGILRIDGSFDSTHKEDIKQTAINKQSLITANTCAHVFELNDLMEKNHA